MNKKLNLFIRIFGIVAALAAGTFAYLLKGKMGAAMAATAWAVTDPEVNAPPQFDGRMAAIGEKVKPLLDAKSKKILELEGNVKDLRAEVADKTTKIEGLTANVTTLEGERAELTRKRDDLTAQLTEATSKRDSLAAELETTKAEVADTKSRIAAMFSKEQMEESIAKVTQAEEKLEKARGRYVQLYGWASGKSDSKPPYPRDPLAEEAAPGAPGVPSFGAEGIVTKVIALDTATGLVAFSVGEHSGVRAEAGFEVHVSGIKSGSVRVSASRPNVAYAQLLPGFELKQFSNGTVVTLVPFAAN
ncbi:MAG: hypothetical protein ACO3ND_09325 [Opitutales bacterium]